MQTRRDLFEDFWLATKPRRRAIWPVDPKEVLVLRGHGTFICGDRSVVLYRQCWDRSPTRVDCRRFSRVRRAIFRRLFELPPDPCAARIADWLRAKP